MSRKSKAEAEGAEALDQVLSALAQPANAAAVDPTPVPPPVGHEEPDDAELHQQMISEVGDLPAPEATIAELVAGAKASGDYLAVLSRIHRDTNAAEATLAELEAGRATVILDGKDVGDFHRELFVAKQTIVSLKAAEKEVQRRYEAVVADEARVRLEALAAKTVADHVQPYRDKLKLFHAAMVEMTLLAQAIDADEVEITNLNEQADRAGRADLRVSLPRLRQEVSIELGARVVEAAPIERLEGESEEMFELRRGNAQSIARDTLRDTDPFRLAGNAAASAIEELAFDMDPHERTRNRRIVNVRTFRSYGGQRVMEVKDVIGATGGTVSGAPLKPVVGPYTPHGQREIAAPLPGVASLLAGGSGAA